MNTSFTRLRLFTVLTLIFAKASLPFFAEAGDRPAVSAESVLRTKLLDPLQKKEEDRSRFSRAALPPQSRRIRILDETPQTDGTGRPFVAFAIDESRGFGGIERKEGSDTDWFKDAIVGCVYPESGEVMVRRGETHYASSVLLGKPTPTAAADVCRPR